MKKYILSILALAAIAFVGCEKDFDDTTFADVKGEVINFGAGALQSRTIYESTDSKQIHWQTGDTIRIYCDKAIGGKNNVQTSGAAVAYADYVITVDATDKSYATIALPAGKEATALKWGESGVAHKFYAVYPHDAATDVAADGTVTFPINRNQICYIQTADEKAADADASKYTYVARPDMTNAYMVAEQEGNPSEFGSSETKHNNVWLDFKPIMTTINIVVKGPQNLNSDGTPDTNNTLNEVLTGVSLVSEIYTNTTASKDEFYYKIAGENSGITAGGSTSTGAKDWQSETTFVTLINQDTGLGGLTLSTNQTLCITAFLPPMAVKTAGDLQRKVSVRVHTTGGNKTMTLENATALIPSAKGAIKLPAMYTPITGSNWITPLDDNIYVSQLSIPGTHDAGTGNGTTLFDAGQTQFLSIEGQWDLGIRCFDLRPAVRRSDNKLWIYHGMTFTELAWDSAIQTLINKLTSDECKDEFAIVLFRHENETSLSNPKNTDAWSATMASNLETWKTNYPNNICTDFKHDMTIGELRGKILFITRDKYESTTVTSPIGVWASPWGDKSTGRDCVLNIDWNDAKSGNDAKVRLQDYYAIENAATKLKSVIDMLEETANYHIDSNNYTTWTINHFSGYDASGLIDTASSNDYLKNAQNCNVTIYNYLLGNTVNVDNANYTKSDGSTGIVLIDWVGKDVFDTRTYLFGIQISGDLYNVYGSLLTQTIIDNNYKYRMKRKGE